MRHHAPETVVIVPLILLSNAFLSWVGYAHDWRRNLILALFVALSTTFLVPLYLESWPGAKPVTGPWNKLEAALPTVTVTATRTVEVTATASAPPCDAWSTATAVATTTRYTHTAMSHSPGVLRENVHELYKQLSEAWRGSCASCAAALTAAGAQYFHLESE